MSIGAQARGSEFGLPVPLQKAGMVAHACNWASGWRKAGDQGLKASQCSWKRNPQVQWEALSLKGTWWSILGRCQPNVSTFKHTYIHILHMSTNVQPGLLALIEDSDEEFEVPGEGVLCCVDYWLQVFRCSLPWESWSGRTLWILVLIRLWCLQ